MDGGGTPATPDSSCSTIDVTLGGNATTLQGCCLPGGTCGGISILDNTCQARSSIAIIDSTVDTTISESCTP